jgi:hypothetical protein
MKFFRIFSVFFASIALVACATPDNSSSVYLSPSVPEWKVTQVHVTQDENKTVISANFFPKSSKAKAYIQAQAADKDGTILATTECKRTPMHSRHTGRQQQIVSGGYSQISFPQLLQSDAKITLGVFNNKRCTPQTT